MKTDFPQHTPTSGPIERRRGDTFSSPKFDYTPPRPKPAQTLVSIVLPVFNELDVLQTLIGRVRQAVAACGAKAEIIFVDDGSTDGSAGALDQIASRCGEVRVIHFSRNFGHQAAVQAGLRHARGDAVVLMDSDLQDKPEAIGRLLDAWRAGYDVVYAVREKRKEQALKRLAFAAFHKLLSSVSTTPIPADAGNFGLIDARVVREIVSLSERDRYLPGLRAWVGFRQTGVVVERSARYDNRPRVSLRGLWRLAKTAIFSFSTLPLTVFHLVGYGAMSLFLALAGYALYCRLFTSLAIPGWTSYILSASFFGALNALGIGMLGEYVLRIYDQVRARPLYLIDRTVNFQSAEPERNGAEESQQVLDQAGELLDLVEEAMTIKNTSTEPSPVEV